jgi:hypothetical protein
MRFPAVVRLATITGTTATNTFTKEPPVEGRSGGALVDARSGQLVGVVVAYNTNARRERLSGVYTSHAAILRFLARSAPEAIGGAYSPRPYAPGPARPPYRSPAPPDCPPGAT